MVKKYRKNNPHKYKITKSVSIACVIAILIILCVFLFLKRRKNNRNEKQKIKFLNEEIPTTRDSHNTKQNGFMYFDIRIDNMPFEEFLSTSFPNFDKISTIYATIPISPQNYGITLLYESFIRIDSCLNGLLSGLFPDTVVDFIEFYSIVCIRIEDYITATLKYLDSIPVLLNGLLQKKPEHDFIMDSIFSFVFNTIFSDDLLGRYFRALNTYKEYTTNEFKAIPNYQNSYFANHHKIIYYLFLNL